MESTQGAVYLAAVARNMDHFTKLAMTHEGFIIRSQPASLLTPRRSGPGLLLAYPAARVPGRYQMSRHGAGELAGRCATEKQSDFGRCKSSEIEVLFDRDLETMET